MPPKKHPTVWTAEPHTLAKIAILRDYLIRWFQILGISSISRGQDLIYVDGFAGPGEYTNHKQGSPLEALIAAKKARADNRTQWKAGLIHCVFIEADKARFEHLQQRVQPFDGSDEVKFHLIQGQFTAGLKQLQEEMPNVFDRSFPLFVFIDPFGAKGVPFRAVSDILNGGCAEVLINFDADGILRNHLNESVLNEVFGDDSWRSLRKDISFSQQCQQVLELYKSKIRSEAKYVFSFEMRTSEKSLNGY